MALVVRAYAKLNLTLEVLGRRPDGYHEITSVLQTVSLADVLSFTPAPTLSLRCSDPALASEDNLALRAAQLLRETAGCTEGAEITLEKHIPIASGLGGGSADAAAALWSLNQLWDLRLPAAQVSDLAARLGSDVPFFLQGGTALAEGRGERVTQLPQARDAWFLVVRPPLEIPTKTATLYGKLGQRQWTKGNATKQLVKALLRGEAIREAHLYNTFDAVAPSAYPAIGRWRRLLLEAAPSRPHLTGAGPALYIPVESGEHGREVAGRLPQGQAEIHVVHTVPKARDILTDAATS
ncbi:MAG TPA: 4-(cytidine 5'-diphospho)-2-C-methyl-D-erythritol kinase [Dehalococcoidia bacterium]|nr:4-(cytidine 5'-diphospho)-2-C-methyl-D-erythritol kinase [Dehalococcoidia bacterium]